MIESKLSEEIDNVVFGRFHVTLVITLTIFMSTEYIQLMLNTFLIPSLTVSWNLPPGAAGTLTAMNFCGMLLGACVWTPLADQRGRRPVLFTCAVINTFSSMSSVIVPDNSLLLMGVTKIFSGFSAVGVQNVAYTLLAESIPQRLRTKVLLLAKLGFTAGSFISALFAFFFLGCSDCEGHWRLYLFMCALPSTLILLTWHLVPESPRYLLSIKNYEGVRQWILRANGKTNQQHLTNTNSTRSIDLSTDINMIEMHGSSKDYSYLGLRSNSSFGSKTAPVNITNCDIDSNSKESICTIPLVKTQDEKCNEQLFEPEQVNKHANEDLNQNVNENVNIDVNIDINEDSNKIVYMKNMIVNKIFILFSPTNKVTTILLLIHIVTVALAFYTLSYIISRLPALHRFENEKGGKMKYFIFMLACILEIPGRLVPILIVDKIGRSTFLAIASFCICIMLLFASYTTSKPEGYYTKDASVVIEIIILCVGRFLGGALWSVSAMFTVEFYPTIVRASAMGITSIAGRLAGIVASYLAFEMKPSKTLVILSISALIGGIAAANFPRDTTNVTLEDSTPTSQSVSPVNSTMPRQRSAMSINSTVPRQRRGHSP